MNQELCIEVETKADNQHPNKSKSKKSNKKKTTSKKCQEKEMTIDSVNINHSKVPDDLNLKTKFNSNNSKDSIPIKIQNSTDLEENDDWESMFNESGECINSNLINELTCSIAKIKVTNAAESIATENYAAKQSNLDEEEFPHVLEISNFPVEFKNQDLFMVFSQYKQNGFDIKWVDDTHALVVFSSSREAADALTMRHPFVIMKPLTEASAESRLKAKKCAPSLQPYRTRPETCTAIARRLVSKALGVRLETSALERENEKRILREARERKLLAIKQQNEAWES